MFQNDYKIQREGGMFSDFPTGTKKGGDYGEQKVEGFLSDLFGSITKEAVKDVAKSAATEGVKAVTAGVVEGTKHTLREGAKRVGKKAVDKVFSEGGVVPKKEAQKIVEKATKKAFDEGGVISEEDEDEGLENWEMMEPLIGKVMKKHRKKKTPKYEEELGNFFDIS